MLAFSPDTAPLNVTGQPAIMLPLSVDTDCLSIGIQLAVRHGMTGFCCSSPGRSGGQCRGGSDGRGVSLEFKARDSGFASSIWLLYAWQACGMRWTVVAASSRQSGICATQAEGMSEKLNPSNAFIFRIVHKDNVPRILTNGLRCRNSDDVDPNYVNIGNVDLIDKRSRRQVPVEPGGTLNDYIPFYFTPYTPMLLNIKTGYNGVKKRPHSEIVILVSSIHKLTKDRIPFLFTDRHAYLSTANFYTDLTDLDKIDWGILQRRDFRRDNDDLGKMERYQAEALVHKSMPNEGLLGIICYNNAVEACLSEAIRERKIELRAVARPGWYV